MTKDCSRASEPSDAGERQDLRENRNETAPSCTCLSISRDPLCIFHGDVDKVRELHGGEVLWGGYPLTWGDEG